MPRSDLYNFGPLNFYQHAERALDGRRFVNYDVNSHVKVYAEVMFTRNTSEAQIAPSGDFFLRLVHSLQQPAADGGGEGDDLPPAAAAQGNPMQSRHRGRYRAQHVHRPPQRRRRWA